MRWEKYIDSEEVKKAISAIQEPGGVFEVRAIGTAKKDILSGYFRDSRLLSLLMGFSRQEYWSELPFPNPVCLPDPGIGPISFMSPALAGGFFTTSATWEALYAFQIP